VLELGSASLPDVLLGGAASPLPPLVPALLVVLLPLTVTPKFSGVENPPPGAGLKTVIGFVPADVRSLAGIAARN
jgi:hypothetical protein